MPGESRGTPSTVVSTAPLTEGDASTEGLIIFKAGLEKLPLLWGDHTFQLWDSTSDNGIGDGYFQIEGDYLCENEEYEYIEFFDIGGQQAQFGDHWSRTFIT